MDPFSGSNVPFGGCKIGFFTRLSSMNDSRTSPWEFFHSGSSVGSKESKNSLGLDSNLSAGHHQVQTWTPNIP